MFYKYVFLIVDFMTEQDCVVVPVYSYNIHSIILNDLSVFKHVQICVFVMLGNGVALFHCVEFVHENLTFVYGRQVCLVLSLLTAV